MECVINTLDKKSEQNKNEAKHSHVGRERYCVSFNWKQCVKQKCGDLKNRAESYINFNKRKIHTKLDGLGTQDLYRRLKSQTTSRLPSNLVPFTEYKRATFTHLSLKSDENSFSLSFLLLTLSWCLNWKKVLYCCEPPLFRITANIKSHRLFFSCFKQNWFSKKITFCKACGSCSLQ